MNKNEVRLPLLTKLSPRVILFCKKNYTPGKYVTFYGGTKYPLYENVKIDMDYSDIGFVYFEVISAAFAVYNFLLFPILFVKDSGDNENKPSDADEPEKAAYTAEPAENRETEENEN